MVRDPTRTITNFFGSHVDFADGDLLPYMKTKSHGESLTFSGIPILGPMFYHIYQTLKHHREYKGPPLDPRKLSDQIYESSPVVHADARISFDRAFSISPAVQMMVEDEIRKIDFDIGWLQTTPLHNPWNVHGQYWTLEPCPVYSINM
jgi:hypothetical protein